MMKNRLMMKNSYSDFFLDKRDTLTMKIVIVIFLDKRITLMIKNSYNVFLDNEKNSYNVFLDNENFIF
jgi:hypothetical protein